MYLLGNIALSLPHADGPLKKVGAKNGLLQQKRKIMTKDLLTVVSIFLTLGDDSKRRGNRKSNMTVNPDGVRKKHLFGQGEAEGGCRNG